MKFNIGSLCGIASLILAIFAYVPSSAAFTPAILLSAMAVVGAAIAAFLKSWRTAFLTIYFVIATIIVSPIFFPKLFNVERWMIAMGMVGVVLSIILFINYRLAKSKSLETPER